MPTVDDLLLDAHNDGVTISVQTQPNAKRAGVVGIQAGRLKIAVTEAPEKGKATAAVADVLAEALGVKRSQIELSAGASSRHKRFRITGLTVDEARQRLAAQLPK